MDIDEDAAKEVDSYRRLMIAMMMKTIPEVQTLPQCLQHVNTPLSLLIMITMKSWRLMRILIMYRHTSTTVNKYNDNNHDDAVEVDEKSDDKTRLRTRLMKTLMRMLKTRSNPQQYATKTIQQPLPGYAAFKFLYRGFDSRLGQQYCKAHHNEQVKSHNS